MLGLVRIGLGVALALEAAQQLRFEGVTYRPIVADARDFAELVAVWRADDENPAARRALDVIFDASA